MGCTLIYDLKLQLMFANFSVYSFEYYFMSFFLIISIKINNNNNNSTIKYKIITKDMHIITVFCIRNWSIKY